MSNPVFWEKNIISLSSAEYAGRVVKINGDCQANIVKVTFERSPASSPNKLRPKMKTKLKKKNTQKTSNICKKHIHDVGTKVYLHTYNNEKKKKNGTDS